MRPRNVMRGLAALATSALAVGVMGTALAQGQTLKSPESFKGIQDPQERSRALFIEAGKVIQHPRCLNCHPGGDRPSQGADMHPHHPVVVRGADGHGATGLRCMACHQAANVEASKVPGHPAWHLAPLSMAWQQRSLGQICEQLKDRKRNGDKSLAEINEHMEHDTLVGWGWAPGGDREPAPGTQAQFGALMKAWAEAGAACPAP
jgi:hypothetical protein